MAQREHQVLHAPIGMDSSSDIGNLREDMARKLLNVYPRSPGVLKQSSQTVRLMRGPVGARIDGLIPYQGTTIANDLLLAVQSGILYKTTIRIDRTIADARMFRTTDTPWAAIGPKTFTATPGSRVRAIQIKDETIFVQEGFIRPLRFNGVNLFNCGLDVPASLTSVVVGAAGNPTGTFSYLYTTVDEKFRESSPSPVTSVTLAAQKATVTVPAITDPQVLYLNIYRSANVPIPVNYYICTGGLNVACTTGVSTVFTDNTLNDIVLQGGVLAPVTGQNDPPSNASIIEQHHQRVWMDVSGNSTRVKYSNTGSPTQFNAVADPTQPTLGGFMTCVDKYGDSITKLQTFGSNLGVYKNRSYVQVWGDDPRNYVVREAQVRGCIAPDGCVRCDNVVVFPSKGGIWAQSFVDGYTMRPISLPIENMFNSFAVDVQSTSPPYGMTHVPFSQRLAKAFATFNEQQQMYRLNIPPYTYCYNFKTTQWTLENLSILYDSLSASAHFWIDREAPVELFCYPDDNEGQPSIWMRMPPGYNYYGGPYSKAEFQAGAFQSADAFTISWRPPDGAGIPRQRIKNIVKVTVFGSCGPNSLITVQAKIDGHAMDAFDVVQRQYSFDYGSSNPDKQNLQAWQSQGILLQQEFANDAQGRLLELTLLGTASQLEITDIEFEYNADT